MPKLIATVTQRLLPPGLRFRAAARRRRVGSILIMAVAVLVLLALMGTAYISVARLDRQAAEQINSANPGEVIEQLLPAVEDSAQRVILEDVLTLTQGYRPPFVQGISIYDHWDSPITNYFVDPGLTPTSAGVPLNDAWLGSRVPEEIANPNWLPSGRVVTWRTISRPITQAPIPAAPGAGGPLVEKLFESPYVDPAWVLPAPPSPLAKGRLWTQNALTQRLAVSELTITYPTPFSEPSLEGKTRVFPALMPVTLAGNPLPDTTNRIKYLAADADGDGIADAGLVPIMENEIAGVKYYYAVRIVDHGSAINVNTARARSGDFTEGAAAPNMPNRAFFPANIGLAELPLVTYSTATGLSKEMEELDRFKYGYLPTDLGPFTLNLSKPWEEWPNNNPVDRSPDFTFAGPGSLVGQGNADWFMRGIRLENPGLRNPQVASNPADDLKYRAFSWADSALLAYRGGTMMAPRSSDPQTGVPTAELERAFYQGGLLAGSPDSVHRGAANYMPTLNNRFNFFPADKHAYWYRYSSDFSPNRTTLWNPTQTPDTSGTAPPLPVRALLTAHNPVSNSINVYADAGANVPHDAMIPYNHKGRWSPHRKYEVNDIVLWGGAGAALPPVLPDAYEPTAAYICLAAYAAPTPPFNEPIPQQPNYAAPNANWARIIPRGLHVPGATYNQGHAVLVDAGAGGRQVWICKVNGTATPPATGSTAWYALPKAETPPKVSLNTAPFGELFRGFHNVMANVSPQRTPFDTAMVNAYNAAAGTPDTVRADEVPGMGGTFNDPYVGNKFEGVAPFNPVLPAASTAASPVPHPTAMFRSPVRSIPETAAPFFPETKLRLPADQVLLLRAAIAAVNAEDMRDRDMNVTGRLVRLQAHFGAAGTPRQPVDAVVYGAEPQPFITEVFATNNDHDGANPMGYVAVEIHNPYPFPIPLAGFQIVAVDRNIMAPNPAAITAANPDNYRVPETLICDFSDPTTFGFMGGAPVTEIPAGGFIVLENYNDGTATGVTTLGTPATARPVSSGLPVAGPVPGLPPEVKFCYVPGLSDAPLRTVLNHEMMIVKRRAFDGGVSAGTYDVAGAGGATYDDAVAFPERIKHMVPVDSYDFTELQLGAGVGVPGLRKNIHYARQVQPGVAGGTWKFVYPGRYDGGLSSVGATPGPAPWSRKQGTHEATWDPGAGPPQTDPWDYNFSPTGPPSTISLAQVYGPGSAAPAPAGPGTNNNPAATYPRTFTIQWANGNFDLAAGDQGAQVGFNRVNPAGNLFPFGGFMRNGDVLHVPFIGAYTILDRMTGGVPVEAFVEMNAVTMDAAMAEDTDTMNDDPLVPETGAYDEYKEQLGRFFPPSNPIAMGGGLTYAWASDVLDHFTAIQNPHDDFPANVDPTRYPAPGGGARTQGIANKGGDDANTERDQEVGIEGMINVNTAPAAVLAQLPLVVDPATGNVLPNETRAMAEAIVRFRDVEATPGQPPHGPFKTLFELNQVIDQAAPGQGFRNMWGRMPDAADSNDAHGDYTPVGAAADGVTMDYEERYGQLIRLSNLITTRSDVFTVYVLVQGWKNVGSEFPVLVAERRSAFIADRSRVNSTNGSLTIVPVPTR